MKLPSRLIRSRIVHALISIPIVLIIGFVDYITGPELSFSIFYLIPLAWLAMSQYSTMAEIIFVAVFSSFCWYYVEISTNSYSSSFYPVWNALVRQFLFAGFGWLLYANKRKEIRLTSANRRLEELNNEKNKFLGIAAHDLRNPLAGMHGLAEILEMDSTINKESTEVIRMIRRLSNNMLQLISNLLDVSKIESGNLVLQLKEMDYNTFLREYLETNRIIANRKEIKISADLCELDKPVIFDPGHLGQVINNLLSNAIKYSNRGSLIYVRTEISNSFILTAVIDQGRGIPDDEQLKLFNYFQRTSTQPTEGESSTGLGLAIAKKIILAHGGNIGLRSKVGEGSEFYFEIPYNSDDQLEETKLTLAEIQ